MTEHDFLDIITGRRRGLPASLLRALLHALSVPYAAAMHVRNGCYDRRVLKTYTTDCPVVSIGNITTGGTGKTPFAAFLAQSLKAAGWKPGFLSRGYRAVDEAGNDEKRLLAQQCPDVPHLQDRDRVAGARTLLDSSDVDVILLDDGFQHRRLARTLDIVLIDALQPWGGGHVLPRGLLREPRAGLKRADVVVITRCDSVGPAQLASLQQQICRFTGAAICGGSFIPGPPVDCTGQSVPVMDGRHVLAFCGIGNPSAFRHTLGEGGIVVDDDQFLPFPDHHHYGPADEERIAAIADALRADMLVTTQKDLVKIQRRTWAGRPLVAVPIHWAWSFGAAQFQTIVSARLPSRAGRQRRRAA